MRVHRTILAGCVAAACSFASTARADLSKEAERLFDEGTALLKDGNYDAACPKLEASNKIEPGVGVQLWLANCFERAGRSASAYKQYLAAEQLALATKDVRDKIAHKRAVDLEPRVPRLRVVVAKDVRVDGLAVTRDGEPVPADGEFALVDAGAHVVRATAPGHEPWEVTVSVAVDGATDVPVGPLTPVAGARPAFFTTWRIAGVVAAGVGVAALAAGTAFGLMAQDDLDASNSSGHCDALNTCDVVGLQLRQNALTSATLSTVSFVAGGVLVAGGVTAMVLAPRVPRAGAAALVPTLSPTFAGVAAVGRF